MIQLILWAALLFGLVYLITASAIFAFWRNHVLKKIPFIREMVACAPCTSFWVGLVLGCPGAHTLISSSTSWCWLGPLVPAAFWDHFLGGFIALGLVSAFQFWTAIAIAEDGEEIT